MDDLRSEIRAAFEREQAAHAPEANLRHTVVRSVATRAPRQANLQWLAVAAALMIGVLVVVSLVASRLHLNTPVNTHGPVGDYGPPPAGVPLVYVDHPTNGQAWVTGYDWSGAPRATVKFSSADVAAGGQVVQSPDGQAFSQGLGAKGGDWRFYDRLGHFTGEATWIQNAYSVMWADDGKHVCAMNVDTTSMTYTLWTSDTKTGAKPVAQVAHDRSVGQTVLSLAACSFRSDQAIVVRTTVSWPSELWVIRLSDGKVLGHRTFTSGGLSTIAASADARYVAANTVDVFGTPAGQTPRTTIIRRVADWAQVADVGTVAVLEFSGDDSRVLVTRTLLNRTPAPVAVMDWATASTVWQYAGTGQLAGELAEPGGRAFALAFAEPQANGAPSVVVRIVRGDGSTVELTHGFTPAF